MPTGSRPIVSAALPIAALLALVALAGSAARSQTATVVAQVTVQHARNSAQARQRNANVVVWLVPLGAPPPSLEPASAQLFRMTQRDKQFHPHVLAVPLGATVQFPNQDPFFHNVFSLYKGERFDLGLYEAGASRAVRFDRPGVSFVFCNIHPEMSAYVLALDTPYFAASDPRGDVRILGVPEGRYRLEVWYERAETPELARLAREITVTAPQAQLGAIRVRESERFLAPHLDKHGKPYEADRKPYE